MKVPSGFGMEKKFYKECVEAVFGGSVGKSEGAFTGSGQAMRPTERFRTSSNVFALNINTEWFHLFLTV